MGIHIHKMQTEIVDMYLFRKKTVTVYKSECIKCQKVVYKKKITKAHTGT